MKKTLSVALALCLVLGVALSGCGDERESRPVNTHTPEKTIETTTPEETKTGGVVNVYNWGEYIDESIFRIFENETGIKVNYSVYQSNEEMYSTMKLGTATYDVIIPSDYMISRLIEEDMLEELDFMNIPNFSLIDDDYKNLEYDPEGKYSVPYMTGTVGLIYNSAMIDDEITSWSALFDSSYSGQILMFDNPRDAFGLALKYLGYSQNTVNETEIREAYDLLVSQKPIVQAYVMDQILDKLESGEAWIGPYYAGDYLTMLETNPDLVFVRPDEGSNFFVDAMCIPKGARNKTNAEIFIDFMCRTDISLANMEFIYYASPNPSAIELFDEDFDPEEYEIMFASKETLANCEVFTNLPADILALYNTLWVDLKK